MQGGRKSHQNKVVVAALSVDACQKKEEGLSEDLESW
jgi:hypothetical protein